MNGHNTINKVHKELINLKISTQNIVSTTTDDTPSMFGKRNGFIPIVSSKISHHTVHFQCIIHQEAFRAENYTESL